MNYKSSRAVHNHLDNAHELHLDKIMMETIHELQV